MDCSFAQTKHAFSDDGLARLYADYRSPSYNAERISYEPTYAAIAGQVGLDEREVSTRVNGLTDWLKDKVVPSDGFTMLDFGGSDGRFLPRLKGQKFVFEVSNVVPLDGVTRIHNESDLGTYSYVQIAHVLEHVPEPLALLKHVSSFVKPSGYLYIEVPQDLPDERIDALKRGEVQSGIPVHEHINMYSRSSVACLAQAAGLELIASEAVKLELGWITATNVRALCRKVLN